MEKAGDRAIAAATKGPGSAGDGQGRAGQEGVLKHRFRSSVRDRAARLLYATGTTLPAQTLAGRLAIVTFHRVLPEAQRRAYPLPGLVVTPSELAWFLSFFKTHFSVGPLNEQVRAWRETRSSPKPHLALTFDDGQRDNFEYALPELERAGVRATFFVPVLALEANEPLWHDRAGFAVCHGLVAARATTASRLGEIDVPVALDGCVQKTARAAVARLKELETHERSAWIEALAKSIGADGRPPWDGMMSWEELARLAETRHEIGSHTMSHSLLPQCGDREVQGEVGESRRILCQKLGIAVESFCYPNGSFDERTLQAVARAGYRHAVTTRWGTNPPGADLLQLKRCDMNTENTLGPSGELSEPRLAWRMSGRYPGLRD